MPVQAQPQGLQWLNTGFKNSLGAWELVANVSSEFGSLSDCSRYRFNNLTDALNAVIGGADVGDGAFPWVGLAEQTEVRIAFDEGGHVRV